MRIDIILAERSRVRADLVSLEKGMQAASAKAVKEGAPTPDEKRIAEGLAAEYLRLAERLNFIDGTIRDLQQRKTG
jgi:hypothetical protein